jgi:hypothetical protein
MSEEKKMTEEKKIAEDKKLYEEKKVVDPFIAGFYESMAKTITEKITKEIIEGLSEDSDDSDDYDVESGDEDCWNLLSAASGPTGVNYGDNRVTCTGAIALFI